MTKHTLTIAQARRYWLRPGVGHALRARIDAHGQWSMSGTRVRLVAPVYAYGVEFRPLQGPVFGYPLPDREPRYARKLLDRSTSGDTRRRHRDHG